MQRWRAKIAVDDTSGCWRWTAAVGDHGYPRFFLSPGVITSAHRWGYEQFVGPIPEGLVLDHVCHTRNLAACISSGECLHRRCVNPAHLEPVTSAENTRRGAPGLAHAECKNGHEFTPENTSTDARGRRQCRPCFNARKRAYMALRRAS